jgi:hypothetical protein
MALLEQTIGTAPNQFPSSPADVGEAAERAARRSIRAQIAKLERDLATSFVTAFPMGGITFPPATPPQHPRLLDLGEPERLRDARISIAACADVWEANRVLLERMLLEPGKYRFARVARSDVGEPGCGVWQVRPRLGLIGMLAGWWHVKLSSGCPLPGGRGLAPRP